MERVAITGMGAWCSIGRNLKEFHLSLSEGRSGQSLIPLKRFDTESPIYRTQRAAIIPYEALHSIPRTDDTVLTDVLIDVINEAVGDSGIDLSVVAPQDVGICLGTTVGGGHAFVRYVKGRLGHHERGMDVVLQSCTGGSIAGSVSKHFKIQGPLSVVSTACAAGTNSVGRAFDLIRKRKAKYVIAGGVDVFSELTFSGFNSLQALARNTCRPFDETRDGLMLGDACGILILENLDSALKRNAKIYAQVSGYSIANEAYHPTGPDPSGAGALQVMTNALIQAGLDATSIDYINAHGTGTKANDEMELKAIEKLIGNTRTVYISSTKSMIGHTLGGAGSIELIATVLGIFHGFVPPTINLMSPIPSNENLIFVRDKAIITPVHVALSNSFGFGGNVASIVAQRV